MTLIHNEYGEYWVWVEENNHNFELSPQFNTEEEARTWRARMRNILLKAKND